MRKFFQLEANQTDIRTEILAGITTFLATAYIIIVNPLILSKSGMPFDGILTATILVSFFSSVAMGIYAKNPIVLAPGMGINAFFTFTVVLGMGIPWETALGAVFWSGVIFLLLSVFNIRSLIVEAIPPQLKSAISCGIGVFIAFIGLNNSGVIVPHPETLVTQSGLDPKMIVFLLGLAVTSILVARNVRGSLLIGIIFTALLCYPLGRFWGTEVLIRPTGIFSTPNFSLIGSLDLIGSLKFSFLPVVFSFLFTDMFDSLSTFIGVSEAGDLKGEDGQPRNIKKSLIVDSLSTFMSGIFGTSSGTSFIESAAGIQQGGRTGLVAVVAGVLFLPFLFFSPLLSMIPGLAIGPVLVLVGAFMMKPITQINWGKMDDAIPSFLALILIPLSYSITHGIVWGFLFYTAIKLAMGKKEEVTKTLLIIDLFAILALVVK